MRLCRTLWGAIVHNCAWLCGRVQGLGTIFTRASSSPPPASWSLSSSSSFIIIIIFWHCPKNTLCSQTMGKQLKLFLRTWNNWKLLVLLFYNSFWNKVKCIAHLCAVFRILSIFAFFVFHRTAALSRIWTTSSCAVAPSFHCIPRQESITHLSKPSPRAAHHTFYHWIQPFL